MASSSHPRILVYKADGAIQKGAAVKGGSDKNHVALATAASDKIIGWAQCASAAAGDKIEIALPGGGAKVLCGAGAVSCGDLLTAGAAGVAVSTSTNADRYGAVAMQDAVSGDLFDAEIQIGIV